jgi:hypothetical protein
VSITFRPAVRANVPLLISLAGGTGSGKTLSALYLARGLAGGKPFAGLDTENGRMLHYADEFPELQHAELEPPFHPDRYAEAIRDADSQGFPVILVDSGSHAYSGEGGILDMHETELQRMAGEDWKKREALTFAAWVKPKQAQKQFVSKLLQINAHVIVCLRAETKIEIVKVNGKTEVRAKETLTSILGWIPICERRLPFELTMSFLVTPDAPGVPKPVKLQEQHRGFFPLDQPITETAGRALGEWAAGGAAPAPAPTPEPAPADPDVFPVTVEQWRELVRASGLTAAEIAPVGRELFPGRSVEALSDLERGRLWGALSRQAVA